jgi:mannose-6-phosphate isomerase-like protein (cupin superfamily)
MNGFHTNIEKDTQENNNFRKVIFTGEHMQLVLMSLLPGEEIGKETHNEIDQFFRFETGTGTCEMNGKTQTIQAGDVILVPARTMHNIKNTDEVETMKLYTIYAAPNHKPGTIHKTKKEASLNEIHEH